MCKDFAAYIRWYDDNEAPVPSIVIYQKLGRRVAIVSCSNREIQLRVANDIEGYHIWRKNYILEDPATSFDSIVGHVREAYDKGYTING